MADVVSEAYELLRAEGPEGVMRRYDDFFAPDFEWRPALVGIVENRTYTGRDDFERYWGDFTEAFSQAHWGPAIYEEAGGNVLMIATVSLTGDLSGATIERQVAFAFKVRGGRIAAGGSFLSEDEAREFVANA